MNGEIDWPVPTNLNQVHEELVEFVDVVGGLMFRSVNLKKDWLVDQHVHEVDHVTVVGSGGVRFWKNGKWEQDIYAFSAIEVKAGDLHIFQALENNTKMSCVFDTSTAQFKQFMTKGG